MIRNIVVLLITFFPAMLYAQQFNLVGIYNAETAEYDTINHYHNPISHSLSLYPDKSFIYKKADAAHHCDYTYIGKWSAEDEKVILEFYEDEPLVLAIRKEKNIGTYLLQNNDLMLYPKYPSSFNIPVKQTETTKKKKVKDTPCPRF